MKHVGNAARMEAVRLSWARIVGKSERCQAVTKFTRRVTGEDFNMRREEFSSSCVVP